MKLKLHWQILIAIVAAALIGSMVGAEGSLFGVRFVAMFDFVGSLFIRALRMLIVPLVASSIIIGVAGLGSSGELGRLGGKTLGLYALTTLLAILVGLALVNIFQPGIVGGVPARELLALDADTSAVMQRVAGASASDIVQIFVRMIPPNVVDAAGRDEMLGIIFFSLLFGYFITRTGHESSEILYRFWNAVFQVMMLMTEWVMKFAPLGVFGLVAKVVAETGFQAAGPLLIFAGTVVMALLIHAAITLPMLIRFIGRVRPWGVFPALAPAMLTAFSTASSSATLPITMECVEKNAGVTDRVASFVLPLGATVNMNGTALYECVAAMFIAQAYGLELSLGLQFTIVTVALVTSIGVAGIPAASLVAISIILTAVNLPPEAIGVLFVFDRVLDMLRTAVNVFGDACCAIMVARLQGERKVLDPDYVAE
ncbi:MAG: dicarboxylate/amino acid:cation symporter [Gammaproteobacteria bacterium]|nr:dicarboxylate/amino acid:cation symporter [Gammaproteobacteria bacterium]